MAAARAAAVAPKQPLYQYLARYSTESSANLLPVPMMNILNGGAHADNSVDLQEFMIMPVRRAEFLRGAALGRRSFPRAESRAEEARLLDRSRRRRRLRAQSANRTKKPSRSCLEAITAAGYKPGEQIGIALDPAASEFYDKAAASTSSRNPTRASALPQQMVEFWANWVGKYPIVSIEDGMAEDDWDGWKELTESSAARLGKKIQLVGDDLFVTNTERLARASTKASPIPF